MALASQMSANDLKRTFRTDLLSLDVFRAIARLTLKRALHHVRAHSIDIHQRHWSAALMADWFAKQQDR